jgi:hypothetical protein
MSSCIPDVIPPAVTALAWAGVVLAMDESESAKEFETIVHRGNAALWRKLVGKLPGGSGLPA